MKLKCSCPPIQPATLIDSFFAAPRVPPSSFFEKIPAFCYAHASVINMRV